MPQLAVGDRDGYGWYGVLTETPAGLLCAECGWEGTHLGVHAFKAHGLTARAYKERHGLHLSRGLVTADVKAGMSRRGRERPNPALAAARDPAAASKARRAKGNPISPAGDMARMVGICDSPRRQRQGRVTVCENCAVEFCALEGAARRRFCSRSCASRSHDRGSRSTGPDPGSG